MDKVESSELCEAIFGRAVKVEFLKILDGAETLYFDDGSILTFQKEQPIISSFNSLQPYTPSDTIKKAINYRGLLRLKKT